MGEVITEDWLREVGFKWHQLERQTHKHWLLWLGDAVGFITSYEDIGIEVAPMAYRNRAGEITNPDDADFWYVWLRSDCAGRYRRFIHVRRMRARNDLVKLIEAITGQEWNPENHLYGSVRTPQQAEAIRKREQDLDRRLTRESHPWYEVEKDESRGRALPDHMEENIKLGGK